MNIGIFTDTYFPQVSGVSTSIKTLKDDLERKGHTVYIFTTSDPHVPEEAVEPNLFRFTSVPFVSFTDRRIAVRGLFHAYAVAKELQLDIVHTQTEFSMGYIGKFVARQLKIPVVHTYHTMYEDYLHYVMNGHLYCGHIMCGNSCARICIMSQGSFAPVSARPIRWPAMASPRLR
jgi:1,2-diacylglycerol 3-alpha-glucosyltransferase